MMATFTEKAAKELITRITNELAERNISVNVNEMYIGTFHSLCLRIIKENLEFTRLKRNYRLLDTFDQKYLVFRNFHKFKNIEGIDELLSKGGSWKRSDEICTYINHLSEEMVDIEALQSDDNPGIRTLGRVLSVYQEMLEEGNLIDFSTIQTECYKLLMQNKQILEELQDKLQYLMIDEYQDTNYIQEQIVFLLGAKHHNICVVGDDDQGLYRFRGATIRNILEFPHKFENEGCKIIPLVVNYRSNSDIVDFYNEWISTTSGHTPVDILFGSGSLLADVYGGNGDDGFDVWDDASLIDNQRFKKLCRLPQLGVYVDEAHHLFGANLEKELRSGGANKTTLRNTINMLAASTSIVACYNYTGKEIYFTGMFTSNQGDLSVQYYDPESKRLRKYYPDFLALMEDGSYQLIEVKGDNKIDDEVVLAKKAAAEEMAVASGIHYLMYAGSTLMKSNVLEPTLVVQQASIDI